MYFLQGTCHCEIWLVTSADSNIDRSEHCFLFPSLSTYQASATITVHCEIGCQGAADGVRPRWQESWRVGSYNVPSGLFEPSRRAQSTADRVAEQRVRSGLDTAGLPRCLTRIWLSGRESAALASTLFTSIVAPSEISRQSFQFGLF